MSPEDEITCRDFVELVTDYFEGALPAETLALTEEHLVMCDWCSTYAEQMRATGELLAEAERHDHSHGSVPVPLPPPALLDALRSRREGRS
jgi:predicted anti-sigma-YlaC factor YlaD